MVVKEAGEVPEYEKKDFKVVGEVVSNFKMNMLDFIIMNDKEYFSVKAGQKYSLGEYTLNKER